MELAVAGFVVVESVLPAAWILTRLAFTLRNVLPEVSDALRRYVLTDCFPEILVGQLAIFVIVKPVKQLIHLLLGGHERHPTQKLIEALKCHMLLGKASPGVKHAPQICVAEE